MQMLCPRMVNISAVAKTIESSMEPSNMPPAGMMFLYNSEPTRRKPSEIVAGNEAGTEMGGVPLNVSVAGCNQPEPESTPGLPTLR